MLIFQHTKHFKWIISAVLVVSMSSCGSLVKQEPSPSAWTPLFTVNEEKYAAANPAKTRIEIHLATQKAELFNGADEVIMTSDVSTGKPGRETPRGSYKILERIIDKRSNKYGQYVDKDTKEVIVAKAWEHKGKRPVNTVYQGIAMPYWMRLTWYGVGMHVGEFNRGQTSSFGCIRVPEGAQPYFFNKTKLGTRIRVR